MSHKYTEIDCTQFQSALILGRDNANSEISNGVGKSVIFHAIRFVLFGKVPTPTIELIIREGAKKAKVTFIFEIEDRDFKIIRSRTKTKTKVELYEKIGDNWSRKNQKTSTETHTEIQKILSINADAFDRSVLFSQNDLYGLASAKNANERRDILKNALGLVDYKKLEKIAKDKASDLAKEITSNQAVAESLGNPDQDVIDLQAKLSVTNTNISTLQKKQSEVKLSLKSKQSEFSNLQRLVRSDVAVTHDKLNSILDDKSSLSKSIKSLKSSLLENKTKISSIENNVTEIQEGITQLVNKKNDLLNKPLKQLVKLTQDLEKTKQNELNGKAYVGSLNSKADELRTPLPQDEECPTCHQEITEDYKQYYQKYAGQKLRELQIDIADKTKKLKAVSKKKLRLEKEIENINQHHERLSSLDQQINNKNTELQNNKEYIERLRKINSSKEDELSNLEFKLAETSKLETSLRETLQNLSKDDVSDKILLVKKDIESLEASLEQIDDDLSEAYRVAGTLSANIETRKKDALTLKEKNKTIEFLNKEHRILKKVQEAFSSRGIPTLIIHTILDDLQFSSNKFLSLLKPGLEVQFDKDLNIFFRVEGRDRVYQQLSGGQKMDYAFALKLGLSVVIQRRLGVDIKMLLLDEVDQSLDAATVVNYAHIIKKLQEKFKIFIITHNERLKNKFSHRIIVESNGANNGTTSYVETC